MKTSAYIPKKMVKNKYNNDSTAKKMKKKNY